MSAHDKVEYAVADGNDYAEHERTYEGFITLTKDRKSTRLNSSHT